MEILQQWDNAIFQFINQTCSNGILDTIIPWLRNKYLWVPLYMFLIVFTITMYKKQAYIIIVSAVLCLMVSDQLTSSVLKPTLERERPCNVEQLSPNILAPCRQSFSMPSAHASNHFAIALFFMLIFGRLKVVGRRWLMLWATVVCFAQVYVGLHYFSDVFVGSILGIVIGGFMYFLLDRYYLSQKSRAK